MTPLVLPPHTKTMELVAICIFLCALLLSACSNGGTGGSAVYIRFMDGSGCDLTSGSGSSKYPYDCTMSPAEFRFRYDNDPDFRGSVRDVQ